MSSEKSGEAAEIPVAEVVQETGPEYLVAEVVEDLYQEDSETGMFQLSGDSDQNEEVSMKTVGNYERTNTRKDLEEVIQATIDLVDLKN